MFENERNVFVHSHYLKNYHADATYEEQGPPAISVHDEGGCDDGAQGHKVNDGRTKNRLLAAEAYGPEQHWREDEDDDHARELEEHRYGHHHHRVRSVPLIA